MTTTLIDNSKNNSRVEELEQKFGDPWDIDNPTGFAAILAADEQDEILFAGEQMLDEYQLNAEFVPVKYGGRLTRIDYLIEIMRSVYRHDPCLGLSYGISALSASVNLRTAGSQKQCHAVADILLSNRKVAYSYDELQYVNDLARIKFTAMPGMFLGILDTGLRTTIRYALQRKLYGRSVASIPLTRSVFISTFIDLLLCDCLSTVVARAIHVFTFESSLYASAVKYLVPKILIDTMNRLSMILGAQFYLRGGEYAIFQKLLRDLKPLGFDHIAGVACQMTILRQLPRLAHNSWLSHLAAPPETFKIDGKLPPLAFDNLGINAGGQDHLIGSLVAGLDKTFNDSSPESREIHALAESFLAKICELKRKCIYLPQQELTVMASPQTYDLTSCYTVVLTASICLNLWWHNQEHHDPFLQNPAWIIAVLNRLNALLGNEPAPLADHLEASLFAELLHRYENARSFDLTNRYLPGWHRSFSLTH